MWVSRNAHATPMSLTALFPGATQDLSEITIPKSTLPTMEAVAVNQGQEIVADIVFRASQVYPQTEFDANPASRFYVEQNLPGTTTKVVNGITTAFVVHSFTVNILSPVSAFDADDAA